MSSIKIQEMLTKIDVAITNLRRAKKKLSISKIAEKAKVARKTIYNHAELKERCNQAIYIQDEQNKALQDVQLVDTNSTRNKSLTGRKLLEERYRKSREEIKEERNKNAKLLENNRKMILQNAELKNRIEMLQYQLKKLKDLQVKQYK